VILPPRSTSSAQRCPGLRTRRNQKSTKSVDTQRGNEVEAAPPRPEKGGSQNAPDRKRLEGTDRLNRSPVAVDGGCGEEVEAAPRWTEDGKRFAAEQKPTRNEVAVGEG
jgi:hypothetical protein